MDFFRSIGRQDAAAGTHDAAGLFYTTIDRAHVEVREIGKMGRKAVDSNQVFFDGFRMPAPDRVGEGGRGFGAAKGAQSK
jgi:acyl-CoA dehydrogenase